MKQAHSALSANKTYICTRRANVSVQNMEEVISILHSIMKFMKLKFLEGVIDFLKNSENKAIVNSIPNQTQKSEQQIEPQKYNQEIDTSKSQSNQTNEVNDKSKENPQENQTIEIFKNKKEILTRINELKGAPVCTFI
ncbi:hypothetical protein TVAG_081880 [Trichomonas vaginalis G3]|uniref:Uncharacterized protein n=1 Tax=Trichomonas vaginalis (strain ATCC PRA-98 / G3) TaxID=412133 RepID=A2E6Y0_TRIV3|nr:protein ubiquitination [Trichomonas vaginalis G3]EAY11616.1 hypothetical protein TVAG_081880 [Trichomonas vaginalis G3]KAI5516502.1 protein ubiquitination [Trichomonas vaginalis G3]|eukprot:XP_001323839.1 hypothetical protein [Trichomonas vaginalis G3]